MKAAQKVISTQVITDRAIQPVILLRDNLLKINKVLDLNALCYFVSYGKPYEELPSTIYSLDIYRRLLQAKVHFYVEYHSNLDPETLVEAYDFGVMRWYLPNYCALDDDYAYDVRLQSVATNKLRYRQVTMRELHELLATKEWRLQQIAGPLTKKQATKLKVKLVLGDKFSFYEAKDKIK